MLQLLASPGTGGRIEHLLPRLGRWCDVRAADPQLGGGPVLATSWRSPGLQQALGAGAPAAVCFAGVAELEEAGDGVTRLAGVVTASPAVAEAADRAGVPAVLARRPTVDPREVRSFLPAVRARWRERHHLPRDLTIDTRGLDDAVVPTALAVAAAVVVDARWIEHALASGAPTVTSQSAAATVDARHGEQVIVAGSDPVGAATALTADAPAAAALSRAGRRLIEARNDLHRPVAALIAHLGLGTLPSVAVDVVRRRLDDLWTPPGARISARALVAVAPLAGDSR